MKRRHFANCIMVLLIAAISILGISAALRLRAAQDPELLGTAFAVSAPADTASGEAACTITIRCDAILAAPESLLPEKAPYVPRDGVILPETTVAFTPGQTVFDVLKAVCQDAGIQLEYSWTPLYDSYYIEGMNHLYEFDCGPESGWMYRVDGQFPNYGCSGYTLSGGEQIVWCYTCSGLGADVGAQIAQEGG